jgi:ACS family hexuronate transporter-like MFS transporter
LRFWWAARRHWLSGSADAAVAVSAIVKDIPLRTSNFRRFNPFLFAYVIMYAGGGKLVDALGTRRGFIVIMIFWSLVCASHALATTFFMLAASRFLLGMGEGGGFPAATRVVAEWFRPAQRATAMGIINAGTAVGAMVAPPLIAVILTYLNWRWIFVFAGALGLLWTAWWAITYVSPTERMASFNDRVQILVTQNLSTVQTLRWVDLLRIRESRGLVSAKF